MRGTFRSHLCVSRVLRPPTPTRENAAPCGGCILPICYPSTDKELAAPGASLTTTTSSRGDGGGDAQKSERSLLSFAGSDLPPHSHSCSSPSSSVVSSQGDEDPCHIQPGNSVVDPIAEELDKSFHGLCLLGVDVMGQIRPSKG